MPTRDRSQPSQPDVFVSELFYSIQGEGILVGVPSVFIRTSGCNLRCRWCDTKYASWHPEGERVSVGAVVAKALEYPARHCVITGGEPMVATGIHELAAALRDAGFHITIETAGTVAPSAVACDLASISPKLGNSVPLPGEINPAWITQHERRRLQPAVLREWIEGYDFQLKFVVADEGDLAEIEDVLGTIGVAVAPARILLMAEGTDAATVHGRDELLVELCSRTGYRLCPRLHIDLFDNTRGT